MGSVEVGLHGKIDRTEGEGIVYQMRTRWRDGEIVRLFIREVKGKVMGLPAAMLRIELLWDARGVCNELEATARTCRQGTQEREVPCPQ